MEFSSWGLWAIVCAGIFVLALLFFGMRRRGGGATEKAQSLTGARPRVPPK